MMNWFNLVCSSSGMHQYKQFYSSECIIIFGIQTHLFQKVKYISLGLTPM